jgi:hypothetical protein
VDNVRVILPMAWAIVAAVVGRYLYRYTVTKVETRWLAVTGAGAIAAGCFAALYLVTPRAQACDLVAVWPSYVPCPIGPTCPPSGQRLVGESDLAALRSLGKDMLERTEAVRVACTREPQRADECLAKLDALDELAGQLVDGLAGPRQAP